MGLEHAPLRRMACALHACTQVSLSERADYAGGGTYMEALGAALAPPRGHAVLQASALRHAGHRIDSGERWVLVLFLISTRMGFGEHVRHRKARTCTPCMRAHVHPADPCMCIACMHTGAPLEGARAAGGRRRRPVQRGALPASRARALRRFGS